MMLRKMQIAGLGADKDKETPTINLRIKGFNYVLVDHVNRLKIHKRNIPTRGVASHLFFYRIRGHCHSFCRILVEIDLFIMIMFAIQNKQNLL
jgi:hypothetical protein